MAQLLPQRLFAIVFLLVVLSFPTVTLAQSGSTQASNYWKCMNGFSCSTDLLTKEQKQAVAKKSLSDNYWKCMNGFSCSTDLLTKEQKQAVAGLNVRLQPVPKGIVGGCSESGSCYGELSQETGRRKTVRVKGYYKKDGTYVRGYYRSKPRKR